MQNDSPTKIIKNRKMQRPKTYFQLVERVGVDGTYQFKLFLIFLLIWFFVGANLANTAFLFYNRDFQCIKMGLLVEPCENTICELPAVERIRFIDKQKSSFKSMVTEMGEFYCQDQFYLKLGKVCVFCGTILGMIVFSHISDNFGRRKSLLLCLCLGVIGSLVLSASSNLLLASIGLFVNHSGSNPAIMITLSIFKEVDTDIKRQKYTILVQLALALGTTLITSFYYIIPHWRIISILFVTIPSGISLFLSFFYVEETPQFLLKRSNTQALKSLNRIGGINYKIRDIIEEEDILAVKQKQTVLKQFQEIILWPLDLIRFGSLKFITISTCLIGFATFSIHYGTEMVIGEIGFDFFAEKFILQISSFVILVFVYIAIDKMKRKIVGLVVSSLTVLSTGILLFAQVNSKCKACIIENTIYFILVMLVRSAMTFYISVFYVYLNELFPTRVTGLGMGMATAFGSFGYLLVEIFYQSFNMYTIMLIFCGFGFIAGCLCYLMEETKGQSSKVQVEEISMLKDKQKTFMLGKSSFARYSLIKGSIIKSQHN